MKSVLFFLGGLAVLLSGCKPQSAAPAAPPPMPVRTITVAASDQTVFTDFVGQTHADQTVTIAARVEGVLASCDFKDGAFVKEGDLLYTIDDKPLQAAVAQARGAVAQARAASETAERDMERLRRMHEQKVISDLDYDAAVLKASTTAANLVSATGALTAAELQLGYTRLTAPISGLISGSAVSVGNLVGRGQSTVLATLVAVDPIRVRFSIDETFYLEVVRKGGKGEAPAGIFELVLADGSTYAHRGDLAFVDNQVDRKTGTLMVEAAFPNPEHRLRPGLFGRVRFPRQTVKDAIVVPQRAVNELLATYSVFVITAANQAEVRPVKVGARVGSGWIITAGLKPGEQIVVEGGQKLRPGATVQVLPAP